MSTTPRLGSRVRALRRREGLTQKRLAERLGISASYLNLIEHDKRPLPAELLIRIAGLFQVDLGAFAGDDDARLLSDLHETFGDPVFEDHLVTRQELRELASAAPTAARAVVALYQAYRAARESAESLAARLTDGAGLTGMERSRLPSEDVHDYLQRHGNHFPAMEEAAERLWRDAGLEHEHLYDGLVRHLGRAHGVRVEITKTAESKGALRRYDASKRLLQLSEALRPRSRNFQVAVQVALLENASRIDALVDDPLLGSPDARALGRVAVANYFASALLMPYQPFLDAAREVRYDLQILEHRFRASFEQICHRLTTLRRPGAEGVSFHMVRVDVAGNISKRFSATGIRFARFGGACPRWNVHAAFLTPGQVRLQISRMPDGTAYFCIARTVRRHGGGYHAPQTVHAVGLGCALEQARELVYADGVDLDNVEAAVPIGISCRLCERTDCEQRAFPPLQHPLQVDENVRGISFYASTGG